jgi:hypothetical protein
MGLGKALAKLLIRIAKRDKRIKIISLGVFATNEKAINLYKKLGFRRVAVLPKRFKYKGRCIDEIRMDLELGAKRKW